MLSGMATLNKTLWPPQCIFATFRGRFCDIVRWILFGSGKTTKLLSRVNYSLKTPFMKLWSYDEIWSD